MNNAEKVSDHQGLDAPPVFLSFATADRKEALSVCKAIEQRGTRCWISTRDVTPGGNYQEEIVRTIRTARAVVLVFSAAANKSDEIKKELSLASRHRIPVVALRIEDVEPSDAFAYELSTRQWIDAVEGWDWSIDSLTARLEQISPPDHASSAPITASMRRRAAIPRRGILGAVAITLFLAAASAGWLLMGPSNTAAHSMEVRLADFTRLSSDLPDTLPHAVRDEIAAAFSNDGIVRVSTASAAPPGSSPAYALDGTLRREGADVRVITRLTNERSGATLWTYSYNYEADQIERVPQWVAIEAGRIVRCGLFAAATYRKTLPDSVLADYMQFCENTESRTPERGKALLFARKVVAAVPDFSWGWSALEIATRWVYWEKLGTSEAKQLLAQALQAADRAIKLDPTNSQALAEKVFLIPSDRVGQEQLLKKALSARPLDCACEHYIYSIILQNVGRYADSIHELRRAADALALNPDPQIGLAGALIAVGKPDQAKPYIEAAAGLVTDPTFVNRFTISETTTTRNFAAGIQALDDPKLKMSTPLRTAVLSGFLAMESGDVRAKGRAVLLLTALPREQQGYLTAKLLGALGANREALRATENAAATGHFDAPAWLFYPEMRGALRDPIFQSVAERLGLLHYWKTTKTRPDVCSDKAPPPFCRMI